MPVSRHPARASPSGSGGVRPYDSPVEGAESSAGPFTTTWVVASNLPVGSGVIVILSCWAHLTASAPFQARPPGSVSGRLSETASWRAGHHVPVSRCLSATGIRFSVIRFPPGSWALLTVGLPAKTTGPRRGYRVSHARATTGVGALYTPRTAVLIPDQADCPAGACRSTTAKSFNPAPTSHLARLRFTRHQRGFKQFTRPVFPSPVTPRMERGRLGLFPELRTPPTRSRTTHVRVGTGHRARTWKRSTTSAEPPIQRNHS